MLFFSVTGRFRCAAPMFISFCTPLIRRLDLTMEETHYQHEKFLMWAVHRSSIVVTAYHRYRGLVTTFCSIVVVSIPNSKCVKVSHNRGARAGAGVISKMNLKSVLRNLPGKVRDSLHGNSRQLNCSQSLQWKLRRWMAVHFRSRSTRGWSSKLGNPVLENAITSKWISSKCSCGRQQK